MFVLNSVYLCYETSSYGRLYATLQQKKAVVGLGVTTRHKE